MGTSPIELRLRNARFGRMEDEEAMKSHPQHNAPMEEATAAVEWLSGTGLSPPADGARGGYDVVPGTSGARARTDSTATPISLTHVAAPSPA